MYWGGIEVQGDPTASQFIAPPHGVMKATNSTIENAKVAISLGDGKTSKKGGGICMATGLKVINCKRGLFVDDYPKIVNNIPHQLLPNLTRFNDCVFTINNDYPFDDSWGHVSLENAHARVNFIKTDFLDERDDFSKDLLTYGIFSGGSNFRSISCNFKNLSFGIKAENVSSITKFTTTNSVFENCFFGISARNVPFFKVLDNVFNMGGYPGSTSSFTFQDQYTGLAIDHCTGFVVEENRFDGGNLILKKKPIGILARNTSFGKTLLDANEIKSNEFSRLRSGNLANQNNGGNGNLGGLVYKCNRNKGDNFEDITVALGSVAKNQKYAPIPIENSAVDNVFSNYDNGNPFSDINNSYFGGFMRYYYSNGEHLEPLYIPNTVMKISSSLGCIEEEPCYKCDSLTIAQENLYTNILNELEIDFETKRSIYKSRLDGGNSMSLWAELNDGKDWELGYQKALALSPYLSPEIGGLLIESALIPTDYKLNLLFANPELLQMTSNWEFVKDKMSQSNYSIADFEIKKSSLSTSGQEEFELEQVGRRMKKFANTLIRHYLFQDEESGSDMGAAIALLKRYHAKELASLANLQSNNLEAASESIADMNNTALSTLFSAIHSSYKDGDFSLNSNIQALALGMSNSTDESEKMYGENILEMTSNRHFQNEGILGTDENQLKELATSPKIITIKDDMFIYPNPSNQKDINIFLSSAITQTAGRITIFDSTGREIRSLDTNSNLGSRYTLDTKVWTVGIYFVVYTTENGQRISKKLIIQ